jgi:hypothetical protein
MLVSLERQLAGRPSVLFCRENGYLRQSLFKFLLVAIVFVDLFWPIKAFNICSNQETSSTSQNSAPDADQKPEFSSERQ